MTTITRRRPNIDTRIERTIITGMIVSDEFCKKIFPIYTQNESLRSDFANTVVLWCKDYFDKYSKPPGKEIEDIFRRHKKGDLDPAQAEIIEEFLSSISREYEEGEKFNCDYEFDKAKRHFRLSALENHRRKLGQCISSGRIEDGEGLILEFKPLTASAIQNEKGFTLKELAEMKIEEMEWVVDGIIPVGLTLLAGKPKMGKSSLVFNMAIDVSLGRRVFDSIPTDPAEVLYLALEDPPSRIKSRQKDILNNEEPTENCTAFPQGSWPRLDQGGLEKLEKWLEDHPDTKLVIVDTLQKIRKPQKKAGHFYTEDYDALAPLQELAGKHKIAVIVVHHTRKTKADDVFDEITGTTGLTAVADTLAVMSRATGQADRILAIRGRDVEDKSVAFKLSGEYRWVLMGDADNFQESDQRQAIFDYLKRADHPVKRLEIKEALEGKEVGRGFDVLLAKLVENGSIEKIERGLYASRGYQKERCKDKVVAIGRERVNVKRRRRRTA